MNRDQFKQPVSWIPIAISVFVAVATLRGRYGAGPPFSTLVPFFAGQLVV